MGRRTLGAGRLKRKSIPGFLWRRGFWLRKERELVSREGMMRPVGVLVSGAEAFFEGGKAEALLEGDAMRL
jgi:hypothetical protein